MTHNMHSGFFLLPNEIFSLGLSSGELMVYAYLMRCENRETYQCWPSYKTIGKAVQMSQNTVRKYVFRLAERGLITIEPTTVLTKDGTKRNGTLRYTIRPIQEVVEEYHQKQLGKPCLSRTLEDVGTCCSCIIPWCSTAVFFATTLDVPVWGAGGFAPYAVLPFVCPVMALLLAIFGIGISLVPVDEQQRELEEIKEEEEEAFAVNPVH